VVKRLDSKQPKVLKGISHLTLINTYDAVAMKRRTKKSKIVDADRQAAEKTSERTLSWKRPWTSRYVLGEPEIHAHLIWGPYAKLEPDRYLAVFRFKPTGPAGHSYGGIEVAHEVNKIAIKRNLEPVTAFSREFWNVRGLRYQPKKTQPKVEFRFWQGEAPVAFDRVYLFRIGHSADANKEKTGSDQGQQKGQ
jgi:hypothetical protein